MGNHEQQTAQLPPARLLKQHGHAAIVIPDNALFEGGAAETVRGELPKQADLHTLLRLPTGIFYARGVKANVLFSYRKPASETPSTPKLWIYDLQTNKHFTLKKNPLNRSDLGDFVACYHAENPHERSESERFKSFTYQELLKRDKVNLDIFWLKDESLEDSANLPDPGVLALEIAEELEAALTQFGTIAEDLTKGLILIAERQTGAAHDGPLLDFDLSHLPLSPTKRTRYRVGHARIRVRTSPPSQRD